MCLTFGDDGQNGPHGGGGDVDNDGGHDGEQSQKNENFLDSTALADPF